MTDFVNYELINTPPEILEGNDLLYFVLRNVTENGELIPILKNGKPLKDNQGNIKYHAVFKQAFYMGFLEFRIYDTTTKTPYRRITVEGSLHKYWNSGAHNFNDFGIMQIDEVVTDLKNRFGILAKNCILKCLELGVNIQPPYKTKAILNQCLLHKTDRLKCVYTNDEGNYIQTKHQRHFIKIYDKRTHYKNKGFDIDKEILRIEIKYTKMKYLNDKGIYTLQDLLNHGLHNFSTELLKEWANVLIYDKTILDKTKYKDKYSNVNFWLELKKDNFKYHRNNLNKILSKHPENIKNKIAILIKNKCEILNTNTTQINRICKGLIRVVSTFENQDKTRRFCTVTKLNISMQKERSILLSHTGLRYYYKTDKKVFNEVKNKYLSKIWIHSDYETQIKEIAHNIRNKHTNQKTSTQLKYNPLQMQLF